MTELHKRNNVAKIEGVLTHHEDHYEWSRVDGKELTDWLWEEGFGDGERVRITVERMPDAGG